MKKKTGLKILTAAAATLMAVSAMKPIVSKADAYYQPIKANFFVTISDSTGDFAQTKYDGVVMSGIYLEATDLDKDGRFTIDEILKAAHEQYHVDGASAYNSSNTQYGMALTKLWGSSNGGSYGYYKQNPGSDTWTSGNSLNDAIQPGGAVMAFTYVDLATWSDSFIAMTSSRCIDLNEPKNIKIAKKGFDETWSPIDIPMSGAKIQIEVDGTVYDIPSYEYVDQYDTVTGEKFDEKTGLTDENGNISISFSKKGDYKIICSGASNIEKPISAHMSVGQHIWKPQFIFCSDGTCSVKYTCAINSEHKDSVVFDNVPVTSETYQVKSCTNGEGVRYTATHEFEGRVYSDCFDTVVGDGTGHNLVTDYGYDSTCIEYGLTDGIHCSKCKVIITPQEKISKKGHTEVVDEAVEATCAEEGLTEGKHCDVCKKVIVEQESIPVIDHSFGEWAAQSGVTAADSGVEVRRCDVCGFEEYRPTTKPEEPKEDQKEDPTTKDPTTQEPTTQEPTTQEPTTEAVNDKKDDEVPVVTEKECEKTILSAKNDNDASDTDFGPTQAKLKKVTKDSISITWKKLNGAKKYIVYTNKCGKPYKKAMTTKKTSYTKKKLTKGTYYKFIVVAVDAKGNVLSKSKTMHIVTKGGKLCNDKGVTVNKKSISLKKGKTFAIKAKSVKESSKLKTKSHRKLSYESSNTKIATVSSKGKIKATGKGKCTIYVYAQDGVCKTITVKVK